MASVICIFWLPFYVVFTCQKHEINKDTVEGKKISKLKNSQTVKILQYSGLTEQQKRVYQETYKLLKNEDISDNPAENPINEGERITAAFAKACNIYYYMSDDNKASSHIRSLASVEVVNYCDILFLHLFAFGKVKINELRESYNNFIKLFDADKIPRILKNKGKLYPFEEMMGMAYSKFEKNDSLKRLRDHVKQNNEFIK